MFKNACVFSIDEPVINLDVAEELLTEREIREIGSTELCIHGWTPVINEKFAESVTNGLFFRMATKEKILPASIVKDEINKSIAAAEEYLGRVLTKQERAEHKEAILLRMAAVALVKQTFIDGFLNNDFLVVDTASPSKAEDFASLLRKTLGSLKATPLTAVNDIKSVLTDWAIDSENVPVHLERTGSYLIKLDEENKKVRMQGFVDGESLGAEGYAEAGGIILEMSLNYSERIDFSITDGFVLKKIDYGYIETDDSEEDQYLIDLAELELTSGELTELIKQLVVDFGRQPINIEAESAE
jgi:recombination associated protein RdgC